MVFKENNLNIIFLNEKIFVFVRVDKLGLIDIFMYVLVEVDLNWNLMFGYFLEGLNVMGYLYKWDNDVISYYGM